MKEEASKSHREPLAGSGWSSTGFLQAIRGSQQHQENLGGPEGKNRQVTSHKHSRTGAQGIKGPEEEEGTSGIVKTARKETRGVLAQMTSGLSPRKLIWPVAEMRNSPQSNDLLGPTAFPKSPEPKGITIQ